MNTDRTNLRVGFVGAGLFLAPVIIAAVLLWMFVTQAEAHDALPTASQPLGWTYDYSCCSLALVFGGRASRQPQPVPLRPRSRNLAMQIGETITVSCEEAKQLRKQGYMPRRDLVIMMYVGLPESSVRSNLSAGARQSPTKFRKEWSKADHAFVARKLAEGRR